MERGNSGVVAAVLSEKSAAWADFALKLVGGRRFTVED